MKCFSNLGSFCRRARAPSTPPMEAGDPLTPPSATGSRRRRRLSGCKSKSGTSTHWRPGLTAISEDVVSPADEKRTNWLRKKPASKKQSFDKSHSFSHPDEYYSRSNSMSMVMPTFSPTPFMF
ncbi:uncharacterized protein LOC116196211 [Punica granatum]|uniref:Uncharacterized protein n=2 Tax=Punica granatum TaxID=22663 RepID=A0A218X1H0_PUNGR|nr:uncharacterized protein LOC116196211 [Punica granatum]OWM78586.1 hypothetical protein CDL15_Pgr002753 [Punica granatum]PKI68622.1 hypothetical protein CRG98_011026 [Punica granatum]